MCFFQVGYQMKPRSFFLFSLVISLALVLPTGRMPGTAQVEPSDSVPVVTDSAAIAPAIQTSPVMFIENVGQFNNAARFQVSGADRTIWLAEDAIWVTILEPTAVDGQTAVNARYFRDGLTQKSLPEDEDRQGVHIKLSFPGASPHSTLEPINRLSTHFSYFYGNDPAAWQPDVPAWGGVRYVDLYPGIDLELSGENGQWQPRFVVKANASPNALEAVHLSVEGAEAVAIEGESLHLTTAAGEYVMRLPEVESSVVEFQPAVLRMDEERLEIDSPFVRMRLTDQAVSNQAAGQQDLSYSTFLGAGGRDNVYSIAIDGTGSAYVVGMTYSSDFPTTAGAFDTTHNSGYDAFVVKVNPNGTGLTYASYLGGSNSEYAYSIAIDETGSAYVAGFTCSSDFPTTAGAFETTYNGGYDDAFVVKVNPNGTGLTYATYVGGIDDDWAYSIAIDGAGSAYVAGYTHSSDFPTTEGAFDTTFYGGEYAFVVKVNPGGTGLSYATYLGGGSDEAFSIVIDGTGSAYVVGLTCSSDFPTTAGAFDTTYNGGCDAFVVKINPSGTGLIYATYLGGSEDEIAYSIAIDGTGSAYVVGATYSSDFPTTAGAFDTTYNGGYEDAFVVKVNPNGTGLTYATFLGGSSYDYAFNMAIDGTGSAYVTGHTSSSDFPTTAGAFDTTYNIYDAFVVIVNPTGTGLTYATYLGGIYDEWAYSIAIDGAGSAYVAGMTRSFDFPTTEGAFDTTYNGDINYEDAFVLKMELFEWVAREKVYLPLIQK